MFAITLCWRLHRATHGDHFLGRYVRTWHGRDDELVDESNRDNGHCRRLWLCWNGCAIPWMHGHDHERGDDRLRSGDGDLGHGRQLPCRNAGCRRRLGPGRPGSMDGDGDQWRLLYSGARFGRDEPSQCLLLGHDHRQRDRQRCAVRDPAMVGVQPAGSGTAVTGGSAWCAAQTSTAGGACNFDTYPPNLAALVVIQQGPTGPAGAAGAAGATGATGATGPLAPSGTPVTGHCANWASSTTIGDAGPCGGGGGTATGFLMRPPRFKASSQIPAI